MTTSSCSSAKQRKQKFSRTQRICWTNCAPIGSISVRQLRRAPVHLSTTSKRTVSLYECHDARDFREAVSSRSRARDDCGNPGAGWGPTGILQARLEELLVQKIVVETARYGRVVALEQVEQPEPGYNLARVVHCLDCTSRYATATSRALYRAIEELERVQAPRKAREESAASTDAEVAQSPAEVNEGQPEKQGENPASSDRSAFEGPEHGFAKVGAA